MTPLQDLLRRAAGDLDSLGVGWALIGGLAVSARSQPRFTADVDLVVAVSDDAQAERLIRDLRRRSWRIDALIEQEATHRLATVRLLGDVGSTPVVDLLFASSGLEPEIVAAADVLEVFPAQRIPVAVVGHLIALKLLARDENRPQDRRGSEGARGGGRGRGCRDRARRGGPDPAARVRPPPRPPRGARQSGEPVVDYS